VGSRDGEVLVNKRAKRMLDIAVASAGLILTLPVLAIVALAVRVSMGSPVLFRQLRPGLRAQPFEVIKFRTMTDARGSDGKLLPQRERLTRLGHFLRRTSLDELPQLWTILKGDMSLVGPRPLLMGYLERYTPEQSRRHEVTPGLTGWAQVHGRQLLDFDERFELDVWYVDHWSLSLDARILALTARMVLTGVGVPPPDYVYSGVRHRAHEEQGTGELSPSREHSRTLSDGRSEMSKGRDEG
jgi:sugar transferase EpsL